MRKPMIPPGTPAQSESIKIRPQGAASALRCARAIQPRPRLDRVGSGNWKSERIRLENRL